MAGGQTWCFGSDCQTAPLCEHFLPCPDSSTANQAFVRYCIAICGRTQHWIHTALPRPFQAPRRLPKSSPLLCALCRPSGALACPQDQHLVYSTGVERDRRLCILWHPTATHTHTLPNVHPRTRQATTLRPHCTGDAINTIPYVLSTIWTGLQWCVWQL